jgi:hypothetical protein
MGIEVGTMMAISAVVSAASAAAAGMAQAHAAEYQANVAAQNAEIARQNQKLALSYGSQQEEKAAMQAQAHAGHMKAVFGASGVRVGSGSHAEAQAGQAEMGIMDQLVIQDDTNKAFRQGQIQEFSHESQSKLYSAEAENAMVGGAIGAGASLLSSGAKGNKEFGWFA